jgi:hypothetical protein
MHVHDDFPIDQFPDIIAFGAYMKRMLELAGVVSSNPIRKSPFLSTDRRSDIMKAAARTPHEALIVNVVMSVL